MEAVSNMATEAARAVWGNPSHGKEPMSGVQGDVPRGEPYDAGNLSAAAQQERLDKAAETSLSPPTSTQQGRPDLDEDASLHNYRHDSGTMLSGGEAEQQYDRKIEVPSQKSNYSPAREAGPDVAASSTDRTPRSTEDESVGVHQLAAPSGRLPRDNEKGTSGSIGASSDHQAPRNAEKETSVGHGDGSADAPSPNKSSDFAEKAVSAEEENGDGARTSVMGDGPKSLADVAKENGGDAGNKSDAAKESSEDDNEKHQESKGTGEEYVRTTGLAADGGDFDATKPGAGREADRLMEEKGMSRESAGKKDGKLSEDGDGGKPSLGERIKNKLHRH